MKPFILPVPLLTQAAAYHASLILFQKFGVEDSHRPSSTRYILASSIILSLSLRDKRIPKAPASART